MLRLFVLETAWKIDNTSTQETRTDIAAVKYTMAKVLREVSFNALHILGSLGTTNLTPLQAMYAAAPTMGIADGVDEVHKATVARNVLKGYRPHEGYWPTEYFPAKREAGPGEVRAALRGRPGAARARRRLREVHRQPAAAELQGRPHGGTHGGNDPFEQPARRGEVQTHQLVTAGAERWPVAQRDARLIEEEPRRIVDSECRSSRATPGTSPPARGS